MPWQTEFVLSSRTKGIHLVTDEVQNAIADGLRNTQVGLLHLFIKHTSASLALGENFDYEVRTDMDRALDHIVPERGGIRWDHVDEGMSLSLTFPLSLFLTLAACFWVGMNTQTPDGDLWLV